MQIGILSTRLNGTDGVSLEVEKWAQVLKRMGHEIFYCAGELGGYAAGGALIPKAYFGHPAILSLTRRAFAGEEAPERLYEEIQAIADELIPPLRAFVEEKELDLLIVENALAIPMNLPLGVALTELIAELNLPTIAHHHDFYWERQRYQNNRIFDLLDRVFPPDLPSMRHVTINSIAQKRLAARRGIEAVTIPNVHDFAVPPPETDEYSRDVRAAMGLGQDDLFILQPTRVIQRKGIELAIELTHWLDLPHKRMVISHSAGDEGRDYLHWLEREARAMQVDLRMADEQVQPQRGRLNGRKVYSLWDIYPHADLVTYPSLYEGFGNALLEAVYFKRLIIINRYPVYNADIGPLGFRFIELDGFVSEAAVARTAALLRDPAACREMAEHNFALAQAHFSLEVLEETLGSLLETF